MVEIHSGLYVGDESDYHRITGQGGWRVVHACKEPFHRQALGYTGRGAPKDHAEYLKAVRGNRLILNLVDAADPQFIPKEIIDCALHFIHEGLSRGERVLVHCNRGESRSPTIGLLYLAAFTDRLPHGALEEAEAAFRSVYPRYNPGRGMRGFAALNWPAYCSFGLAR